MNGNERALQNTMFECWRNGACLGYVIRALEILDFEPTDIQLVVSEMRELFDFVSIDEAHAHYCKSPYCFAICYPNR
ncbi:hypothetical protein [Paenibacillus elgii]|uniref:hypothetical protein n=1 Tax=Paenibacillus elgii TaxID=189691 RepID=UPI000248D86D|nr:hypothetical protein [Paenibacillus elgii]